MKDEKCVYEVSMFLNFVWYCLFCIFFVHFRKMPTDMAKKSTAFDQTCVLYLDRSFSTS